MSTPAEVLQGTLAPHTSPTPPEFVKGAVGPDQQPQGAATDENQAAQQTQDVQPDAAPAPPAPTPDELPNYPAPVHTTERAQTLHRPETTPGDFRLVQPQPLPAEYIWSIPYLQAAAADPTADPAVKQLYWEMMQRLRMSGGNSG